MNTFSKRVEFNRQNVQFKEIAWIAGGTSGLLMTTKPGGGGKGLSGRTTKKITFFCGFPYDLE